MYDIELAQQLPYSLRAHRRVEVVAVLFHLREKIVLGQQLATVQRGHARIGDDIGLEVKDPLDVAQRHVENHAQARRQALQEPDVRNGARKLDMAHALAPHLGEGHFDAAFLADDAAMLQSLVLSAEALVVLRRAEDLRAKKAISLRLEGAVVDGLRLLHLAVGPRPDLVGGCEADADRVEFLFLGDLLEQIEQCFHPNSPGAFAAGARWFDT